MPGTIKIKPKRGSFSHRILTGGGATILVALAACLYGCKQQPAETTKSPAAALPVAAEPAVRYDTLSAKVMSGETFQSISQGLSLDDAQAASLLAGLIGHFPGKINVGQSYRAVFLSGTETRKLQSFVFEDRRADQRHILSRVAAKESGAGFSFDYRLEAMPVRVDTVAVTGDLRTNLYEAFLSLGETPALIQQVTKILAWDIDFFKDPRVGDTFKLLVEKRFGEDGSFLGYGTVLTAKYVNSDREFYGIFFHGAYFDQAGKSLEKILLKAPLNYTRVSSGFTARRLHPILGTVRPHWGIDYAAPMGTKILAAGNGRIEYAGWKSGYGNTIKIRHNGVYNTYYGHLRGFAAGIRAGTYVKQGEVIAYLGMTGLATGPHLDYRVEQEGSFVNPAGLRTEAKEGVSLVEWKDFCGNRDKLLAMLTPDIKRVAGLQQTAHGQGG